MEEGGASKRFLEMRTRGLPDRGRGGDEPACRPVGNCYQHRLERATTRGQSIAHAHGRAGINESFHDAFGLKFSKTLGQNTVTNPRYAREQLIETRGSRK